MSEDVSRVVSFVEEFRGQVTKDSKILVEGNLEKVCTPKDEFFQITLTYGPHYYQQTLKYVDPLL